MAQAAPHIADRERMNLRRHLCRESVLLTTIAVGVAFAVAANLHTNVLAAGLAQERVSFEAVSVKQNWFGHRERRPATVRLLPDGRYVAANVTVRWLILKAYDLASFQAIGGPNWLAMDRFDVDARIPAGIDERRVPEMLRTLLRERFGLVAHKETRELNVFRLVQGSRGLGRNLQRVSAQCESTIIARNDAATRGQLESTDTVLLSTDPRRENCSSTVMSSRGSLSLSGRPLSMLAYWLHGEVGRPVVDRTGLPGLYNLKIAWGPADDVATGVRRDSIVRAIPEQLGLRLESATESFEVLIIERVHHPGAN